MNEKEQAIVTKLAEIFPLIPADKQEYLLGYAEAMADILFPQPQTQPAAQDTKVGTPYLRSGMSDRPTR